MDIRLKSILIRNWKVIDEIKIEFDGKSANIFGYNETGKTTVYDAFLWLLFGKDSAGQKDFDIKPTRNGEVQHNLESTVSAILLVDGKEIELTKIFTEKWTKKRGSDAPEFDGHETNCWFNSEPVKANVYAQKVGQITDEGLFRRITNADAFLTMKKPDMRATLVQMAGDVDNMTVAGEDKTLQNLVRLMEDKSLTVEALIKIAKQNISAFNAEIEQTQPRIDEVKRGMPAYQDWEVIRCQIATKTQRQAELSSIITKGRLPVANTELVDLQNKRNDHASKIRSSALTMAAEQGRKLYELNNALQSLESDRTFAEKSLAAIPSDEELNKQIELQRAAYNAAKAELDAAKVSTFTGIDDSAEKCPACGQKLPANQLVDINMKAEAAFNAHKQELMAAAKDRCSNAVATAKSLKQQIADNAVERANLNVQIENRTFEADNKKAEIEKITQLKIAAEQQVNAPVESDPVILDIDKKIAILKANDGKADITTELAEAEQLDGEIKALQVELTGEERIKAGNQRITELQDRNRELAQKVAQQEKVRDACERFMRLKSEALNDGINALFEYVTFRLFEVQINGGIADDCTPLINGINYYTNGSRSQKIRAGMDIIKAMQKASGVKAPVFIDNAESANWLLMMDCQVIRLIVSEPDKQLRVELED